MLFGIVGIECCWCWVLPAGCCALWSDNLSWGQVSLMVGKVFLTSFQIHCRLGRPRGLVEGAGDICGLVIIELYFVKSHWFTSQEWYRDVIIWKINDASLYWKWYILLTYLLTNNKKIDLLYINKLSSTI